jgi:lipid-A-disaccharide synthase
LCGTPMVTAYKLSPLSAWIGKRMVKTKFFNLVNILFNQPVVPEMMQEHCTAAELSGLAQALLTHQNLNELQKSRLTEIAPMLKEPTKHTAARFVASFF